MEIGLKIQDIVLIGLFNPSKFDRYTFIKNKIFKENDISDTSVFLPELVNIETDMFNVILNNNQLIISSKVESNNDISGVLIKVLKSIDKINLNASGFNFRYFIEPIYEDAEIDAFVKTQFYNPSNSIQSNFFNSETSSFGFYCSKDFKNTRLKLDVKPILINNIDINKKSVQFEFNFHRDYDINDDSLSELNNLIKNYNTYKLESEKIIKKIL